MKLRISALVLIHLLLCGLYYFSVLQGYYLLAASYLLVVLAGTLLYQLPGAWVHSPEIFWRSVLRGHPDFPDWTLLGLGGPLFFTPLVLKSFLPYYPFSGFLHFATRHAGLFVWLFSIVVILRSLSIILPRSRKAMEAAAARQEPARPPVIASRAGAASFPDGETRPEEKSPAGFFRTKPDQANLLCLLFFTLFIFSTTNGNLGINGDDLLFVLHIYHFQPTYISSIVSRAFLTPFYSFIYDHVGRQTQGVHLVFFVFYFGSVLMFYSALRKLFSPVPALLAALFYLTYSGKYETVTWSSAGGYIVVVSVLFASAYLALSDGLNIWVKGIVITILNWLVVHLYEILLIVAPLYPLLFLINRYQRGRRLLSWELVPTLLPLMMFLNHWLLISLNTPKGAIPIWQRDGAQASLAGFGGTLVHLLANSMQVLAGGKHWQLAGPSVASFFSSVPRTLSGGGVAYLLLTLIAAVMLLGGCLRRYWRPDTVSPLPSKIWLPTTLAALYLILVSPLIYCTVVTTDYLPSRYTSLPAIGVALLFALGASLSASGSRRLILPVLLYPIMVEALAFNSILTQCQTSWACDSEINRQLVDIHARPKMGDVILIAAPEDRALDDFLVASPSQFRNGAAQILLNLDYGFALAADPRPFHRRILYSRYFYTDPGAAIPESALKAAREMGSPGAQVWPFYLTPDKRLLAIRQFNLVDDEGTPDGVRVNTVFSSVTADKTTEIRLRGH